MTAFSQVRIHFENQGDRTIVTRELFRIMQR